MLDEREWSLSKAIQTRYTQIARSHAADPLTTLKSVQNHLADLHMLVFLTRTGQNHGEGGGRYYEYQLDLDPSVILDIRREIEETQTPTS
ncbi:hypothetical protein [Halarchaeum sp. P4]|uniref:hypothetical protein n=1 Tax=Halarchaeum sp. P4 TaxID=3421639 RepID=UPI003EBDF969